MPQQDASSVPVAWRVEAFIPKKRRNRVSLFPGFTAFSKANLDSQHINSSGTTLLDRTFKLVPRLVAQHRFNGVQDV